MRQPQIGDVNAKPRDRESLDEIYVREMNISSGGVGCAAWDASVLLSRFIHRMHASFQGKRVHEIGAGVGVPALMAARYADSSVMSDYITDLVDNMTYNIGVNSVPTPPSTAPPVPAVPEDVNDCEQTEAYRLALRQRVALAAKSVELDWTEVRLLLLLSLY